ncbi:SUMF1/EgtB/PvdO family nonheme iron enzyme [bacterium]|nr:SUMF1/EgtB/PvdO family nonheme iron enzyme [bacterium]
MAANGESRDYPWGDTFSSKRCNVGDFPVSVGFFHDGASPWGAEDMAGNVAEWTATAYEPDPRNGKPFNGRFGQPIIKGGSWDDESRGCRVSARDIHRSHAYRSTTVGFRCVSDTSPSLPK